MDFWEKDFTKTLEIGKEIIKILKKNEKKKNKAKNRAILRGKITEFNQNVNFLAHQLNSDYIKNDKNFMQNETKYKNKMDKLNSIKNEISILHENLYSTNNNHISFNVNMKNLNDFDDDGDTYLNDLSKEELLLKQQNLKQLQDEQLNFLEGTTHNLKNISYSINSELKVHNEILDDIDQDIDETNNLLNRNRNLFTRVTNNTSNYLLYLIIAILTIVLILLIVIL